jgi:hypothetical protein
VKPMRFGEFSFGLIHIDGLAYDHDVVIDRGRVRERQKKPSKRFRASFGHTPISVAEKIPWRCNHLVIGTGVYGSLPVMKELVQEADRRGVDLVVLPTPDAITTFQEMGQGTNAILHVTC